MTDDLFAAAGPSSFGSNTPARKAAGADQPAKENPFAGPTGDGWEGDRGLEARAVDRSLWFFVGGLLIATGAALGLGYIVANEETIPALALTRKMKVMFSLFVVGGLATAGLGFRLKLRPDVLIRVSKDGFFDYRSGASFVWSDVRRIQFDYRRLETAGGKVIGVPTLFVELREDGVERRLEFMLSDLDYGPSAISEAAYAQVAADPAASVAVQECWAEDVVAAGLQEGRSLQKLVERLVGGGIGAESARSRVEAAFGGEAARCARCQLDFEPSKTQCPECWEKLAGAAPFPASHGESVPG